MRTALWMLALVSPAALAAPQTQSFESGPQRVALVELYTSEGCSSCPPADRWLGALRTDPRLWRDFAPVAFHVNYWDRLGWKDRLSSPAFTRREYAYSAEWASASVYTPCFVLNGAEWRANAADLNNAARPDAGRLMLEIATEGDLNHASVRYASSARSGRLTAHVALLGGGISTQVRAGENAGATLTHEFVVLALAEVPLADGAAQVTLPPPLVKAAARSAVVAWITAGSAAKPIQAVGGWLLR